MNKMKWNSILKLLMLINIQVMEKYYRITNIASSKSYNIKIDENVANQLIDIQKSIDLEIHEVEKIIYVKVDAAENAIENVVTTKFIDKFDSIHGFNKDKTIKIFDNDYQALDFIEKTYVI